jgi:hypothetical protein
MLNRTYFSWFCDGGLLVRHYTDKDVCLCFYYHYGDRCEFQRRRLGIIVQFDTSDYYSESTAVIKLVFYLIVEESIVDYHQIITVPYQRRWSESKDQYTNHC